MAPDNLNWYRDHRKLRVLHQGRWRRPFLGSIDFTNLENDARWSRRHATMSTLLNERWIRPKPSANMNFLTHYTQATHPHILEGGVFLAFNAISPFEHNVGNTPQKRFVNKNFVTGAHQGWLKRIGRNKPAFRRETFTGRRPSGAAAR